MVIDCFVVVEGFGLYIGLCLGVMIVKILVYILKKELVGIFSL